MRGLTLNAREQARLQVLNKVLEGWLRMPEASQVLGASERHGWRLLAAYRKEGAAALAHGNRGRQPAHTISRGVKEGVVALARGAYQGLNHTHLAELLWEREGLRLSRSTLRRILVAHGLRSPRRRRPPKHRCRRERYPQEGMLLQIDGSRHDWLQGRGSYLSLLAVIDDATGTVPYAIFREQEDAQGYFLLLGGVIQGKGVPLALYSDRHGIFQRSPKEPERVEEQLAGEREPTQFGRALRELGIQPIFARSPQAKGRIERLFGTLQDRLVAELRLAGACTLEEANAVLGDFLPHFNARFGVPPAQEGWAYRPLPPGMDLEGVLCFKYQHTVARDNTVRFAGHTLQLLPGEERLSYAHARVQVQERLDGSLVVTYGGKPLASRPAPPVAPTLRARKMARNGSAPSPNGLVVGVRPVPIQSNGSQGRGASGMGPDHKDARPRAGVPHTPHKPGPDHPWRRPSLTKSLNN